MSQHQITGQSNCTKAASNQRKSCYFPHNAMSLGLGSGILNPKQDVAPFSHLVQPSP